MSKFKVALTIETDVEYLKAMKYLQYHLSELDWIKDFDFVSFGDTQ